MEEEADEKKRVIRNTVSDVFAALVRVRYKSWGENGVFGISSGKIKYGTRIFVLGPDGGR